MVLDFAYGYLLAVHIIRHGLFLWSTPSKVTFECEPELIFNDRLISMETSFICLLSGSNTVSDSILTYTTGSWATHRDTSFTPVYFNTDLTIMFPDSAARLTVRYHSHEYYVQY